MRKARINVSLFLRFLATNFQVITPDRIRRDHLYSYQQSLSTRTKQCGLPCSPRTINSRISSARAFLSYLYDQGYIATRLAEHLASVKEPKSLPKSVLTHNQVRRLLRNIDTTTSKGTTHRAILELLYSTGIRVGELADLTLEDIHFQAAILKIHGKGGKERMVPIGKTAMRYLETYIKGIRPFLPGQNQTRSVFLNHTGNPYQVWNLQRMLRTYRKKFNLDIHLTPHTFRRSCTTELVKSKANIYHIKELLGHEGLRSLQPYINLAIDDLKKTHAKYHPREKDFS